MCSHRLRFNSQKMPDISEINRYPVSKDDVTCKECGKICKNKTGLKIHFARTHKL